MRESLHRADTRGARSGHVGAPRVSCGPMAAPTPDHARLVSVVAVLPVGPTCGTLNRSGVFCGVQLRSLHAVPWFVAHLT